MAGFSGRGARQARGYKTSSDDGYSGLFRDRGAPRASAASSRGSVGSPDRGSQSDGGWRLSDRLYELSLEAEEEEKRVRAERAERHDAVLEAERARDRYKAQLEEARAEARAAYDEVVAARGAARDREDDYVKEIVVLRHELALAKGDGEPSLVDFAKRGDECRLRGALSPGTTDADGRYDALLGDLLRHAASSGEKGACSLLLRRGALRGELAASGEDGRTALHTAAGGGSAEVVELLLTADACAPAGGDQDPLDVADARGLTALMVAAVSKAPDCCRALMRAGADAEIYCDASSSEFGGKRAADLCGDDAPTLDALRSSGERFWNASAAGNRAWRRKDFEGALAHFSHALELSSQLSGENPEDSAPSGVDLARLELNCAKAALRLGRASDALGRADSALSKHRAATRGGVYANALAVRAECRESLYDFEGAAADFSELEKGGAAKPAPDDARQWRERARRARDLQHATHYGVLGVSPRSDDADVRRAYRKASMRWHPDRQKDGDVTRDDRARAERHFRRINEAKEVLLDSYKRAVYDVEARRRLMDEDDRRAADDAWAPWHAPKVAAPEKPADPKHPGRRFSKAFAVTNPPAVAEPPDGVRAASPRPESRKSGYASGGVRDVENAGHSSPPAKAAGAPEEREWSARLQKYEDELQRQRDELDRARAARVSASEERDRRDKLADRLEAEVAAAKARAEKRASDARRAAPAPAPRGDDDDRRFGRETNGDEELRGDGDGLFGKGSRDADPATSDDDDDDDLPSTAGAAGFFARDAGGDHLFDDVLDDDDDDDMDDDDDDDDGDGDDGGARKDSEDLVAQLRDAAEWFDQLDAGGAGELSMAHFDALCEKLGLKEVLGDAEMKRQRFFADPVGAGVLRRGTFLGWFAALLEGSDAVAPPPPPRAKAADAPPPPPPPTFA